MVDKIDKIDLEDLLKDFKELNQEAFILYVKSVWKVSILIIFRIYHKDLIKKILESIKTLLPNTMI